MASAIALVHLLHKAASIISARIAISAMREPTAAMAIAAVRLDLASVDDPTWPEGYRAMVDAALSPKGAERDG